MVLEGGKGMVRPQVEWWVEGEGWHAKREGVSLVKKNGNLEFISYLK